MLVVAKGSTVLSVSVRPSNEKDQSDFVNVKVYQDGGDVINAWGFKDELTADGATLPTKGDVVDLSVNAYVSKAGKLSVRIQEITPSTSGFTSPLA